MYPGPASICTVTVLASTQASQLPLGEMIARIHSVPVDRAVDAARANTRGFDRAKALVLEAGSGSWRTLTRPSFASRPVLAQSFRGV